MAGGFGSHLAQNRSACRKPKSGLFMQAAKDFHVDFPQSVMYGDKESDWLRWVLESKGFIW